jgi:hypothetical protein
MMAATMTTTMMMMIRAALKASAITSRSYFRALLPFFFGSLAKELCISVSLQHTHSHKCVRQQQHTCTKSEPPALGLARRARLEGDPAVPRPVLLAVAAIPEAAATRTWEWGEPRKQGSRECNTNYQIKERRPTTLPPPGRRRRPELHTIAVLMPVVAGQCLGITSPGTIRQANKIHTHTHSLTRSDSHSPASRAKVRPNASCGNRDRGLANLIRRMWTLRLDTLVSGCRCGRAC